MAYSDFTLKEVTKRFELTIGESEDLFGAVAEVEPGARLQSLLGEYVPLARALHTEKARSELLIAPILVEVRSRLDHCVSLFSGIDFPAAPELGLNGVCAFLLASSHEQLFLDVPVIAVIEAKNENIKAGLGQCVAEMVGARLINEREGKPVRKVYGAVTSGTVWQFLQHEGQQVGIDDREYHIERVSKILGILRAMLTEGDGVPLVA